MTITINPNITPTFAQVGPFCSGATIPALPTTSQNNITGTWSPALNNTATTTYTFTPNAGQCATTTTMTISIFTTQVQMSCPPNASVSCNISNLPPFNTLAEFLSAGGSATSLGGTLVASSFALINQTITGTCPQIVTRTYSVQDDCGNNATCDHIITVTDEIAPTGSAPANVTVTCSTLIPPVDVNSLINVADNCSTATVTHISDISNNLSCPENISRIYRITDACGNFTDVTQTITINDNIPPSGIAPINISVACVSDVPAPNTNLISNVFDNCSTPVVSFVSDVSNGLVCNQEVITRTYSITDGCGNETLLNQLITINATTPSATLSWTDPTTCQGADGGITISGLLPNQAISLTMNNINTNHTANSSGELVISGLVQGTYSGFIIAPLNCNLCAQQINQTIVLNDPTAPWINAGQDLIICEGESIILSALNPNNANISWNNNVVNDVPFTPPIGTNTYTVTAELQNCFSTDQVVVIVDPNPIVDAGPMQNICNGNIVTLSASGAETFIWSNGVQNGVPFVQNTPTAVYTVVGIAANGCTSEAQVVVNILQNPTPSFTLSQTESCIYPTEIFFTNTSQLGSVQCTWSFGDGSISTQCNQTSHIYNNQGCYDVSLSVVYDNGCTNQFTESEAICLKPSPTAAFIVNPTDPTVGNPINFINQSTNAILYFWDIGTNSGYNNGEHITHTYETPGFYEITLIALNELGCADTARRIINVLNPLIIYVPNAFTPDGDAFNNTFKPILQTGFDPWNYELTIFNGWGEVIFVSQNAAVGWDGTYGGKICQEGTYIWQIRVKNGEGIFEMHRGHVNLLR
jgi:gliding motility-associated-like protein